MFRIGRGTATAEHAGMASLVKTLVTLGGTLGGRIYTGIFLNFSSDASAAEWVKWSEPKDYLNAGGSNPVKTFDFFFFALN